MLEIIIAISLICGPRTQGTTEVNASGAYVNGYAYAAAQTCQKTLLTCVQSKTQKKLEERLEACLTEGQ